MAPAQLIPKSFVSACAMAAAACCFSGTISLAKNGKNSESGDSSVRFAVVVMGAVGRLTSARRPGSMDSFVVSSTASLEF